ncbi:hypothetical protein LshimejAT787_0600190 [Lyophyllum shimeji]|uniref:Uncharacterized protein n=1 Tax=Lyophyllum shimeji TaxID=47721 RepID=A0A9P3PM44_LYOSH|nr:hypothetical protein LshimejAT787_0600190 [Lyophyllum shimeji]
MDVWTSCPTGGWSEWCHRVFFKPNPMSKRGNYVELWIGRRQGTEPVQIVKLVLAFVPVAPRAPLLYQVFELPLSGGGFISRDFLQDLMKVWNLSFSRFSSTFV